MQTEQQVKNLKPLSDRTPEEVKTITRKGGIASGEARRRKKQLKDDLITLLETGDTQKEVCLALIQEALKGNVKAFNTIRDTIGEREPNKNIVNKNVKVRY